MGMTRSSAPRLQSLPSMSHRDRTSSQISAPIHPGDFLVASVLPSLDASISQAARNLGVSRQTLHRIIARDAPITPELAVRLDEYSGCPAEVWLLLQVGFDLWQVRHRERTGRPRAA